MSEIKSRGGSFNMKKHGIIAFLLVLCFAAAAFAALGPIKISDQKPTFVYVGPVGDGG